LRGFGVGLENIVFKNNIWLASSPFTEKYETIDAAIRYGVGAVVLKSSSVFDRNCERRCDSCDNNSKVVTKQMARNKRGEFRRCYSRPQHEYLRIVNSTSRNYECDLLTIEESNALFDRIKQDHPDVVVVASFAPRRKRDFDSVDNLKGDILEISPRAYGAGYMRPFVESAWKGISTNYHWVFGGELAAREFMRWQEKVIRDFSDSLKHIRRPKLLKWVQEPELSPTVQLCFDVDGFTIADSMKRRQYSYEDDWCVTRWGKGSVSGQLNLDDTLRAICEVRSLEPKKFIAASGGIFFKEDAKLAIRAGADAVQLCSVLYFMGMRAIRDFVKKAA
jgi:hypothetical protein